MEDRIRIFLNNYINGLYFPTVHLTDVIEILIITVIVYEIMLWYGICLAADRPFP